MDEIVPFRLDPPVFPFTLQTTDVFAVFETVAENCWLRVTTTAALAGATATLTGRGRTVTVADPLFVGSAELTAAIVTVPATGMLNGAVYRPLVDMVPFLAEPPTVPLTLHTTPVFDVFDTVAENCWLCETMTPVLAGDTATLIGRGRMDMVADALLLESAELIAVTDTVLGLGTEEGAV